MFDDNEIIQNLQFKFQFQLTEKLGQGSFGTVYKAIDTTDDTECAIKILAKSDLSSSLLEGKLLKQLDHPHIVKFKRVIYSIKESIIWRNKTQKLINTSQLLSFKLEYQYFYLNFNTVYQNTFGETKSSLVIIMELMKGGTIAQLLKQRKLQNNPFTEEESSCIMKCILSAVDYMHSQNILHRDLKPENILLNDPSNLTSVKIADFGLGIQYSSEMTYRSFLQQCGTVFYMSPEQLKEQPYSKPVDLWSCGIIMYMILSMGKHPFNYTGEIETKDQYIKLMTGVPKIEIWPECSNLAVDIITRLTNIQPSNRYNAGNQFYNTFCSKIGKALNHPWITRRLDDQIPLSFEENRQIFQSQNALINIIKAVFVMKLIKHKAANRQLKRISVRKNYSVTSSPLCNQELSPSPLIYKFLYLTERESSQKVRSNQNSFSGIIALNQTKLEQEEEKVCSPGFYQRHSITSWNSPTRKKEFMIKKMPINISSSSSPSKKKSIQQTNPSTPSYFKHQNQMQNTTQSQFKTHNVNQNSNGMNNSHQRISSVGLIQQNNNNNNSQINNMNNINNLGEMPRKSLIKDFKITQKMNKKK